MRITLFGATGKTGRLFLQQALEEGNEVVAFVRDKSKVDIEHSHLKVVEGDIHDPIAVANAIKGSDAVVSTLGIRIGEKRDVLESAAWTIVAGMRSSDVKRLITLATAGVDDPDDMPRWFDKLLRFGAKVLIRPMVKDAKRHADLLQLSDLEWTVVRAHVLTNGPQRGEYHASGRGRTSNPFVSRADVADFILQELGERNYVQRMPVISY